MRCPDDPRLTDEGALSAARRRACARLSPDDRLRWLEDALRFASEVGALGRDRARRAAAADGDTP